MRVPYAQDQFIHLVRLAWDLRARGLGTAVDVPIKKDPVLVIPRASGPLRVMALARKGTWFFTWGRGEDQRVRALADNAADRVWELAQ
jgi:hypothetical protein